MKKYLIVLLAILVLGGLGFWQYQRHNSPGIALDLPPAQNFQEFIENTSTPDTSDKPIKPADATKPPVVANTNIAINPPVASTTVALPDRINLNVPFSSQAPTTNWDQPFQDACEETSVLMAIYYYQNKKLPAPTEVEKLIIDMVKWQVDRWGGHNNLPLAQVADFTKGYFNYKTEIINDLTVDKIKQHLRAGQPVIVPANGKKLANPNFRNGGPLYHMLVIKGYVGEKFITNDPGTRKGADFVYTQTNLMDSIGDWDESQNAASGPKRALILLP